MKILHTSDWHLGHRLHEESQYEEQKLFLNWLDSYISDNEVDILMISGDIFDSNVPSSQSLKLYYDFLINLKQNYCKHIIITGGNHDAPGTLNAPKEMLNTLSIHVVGNATENIEDEIFELEINNEKVIIAAVPFLRDRDIRKAIASENTDEIESRYKTALVKHYTKVAEYCTKINTQNIPTIAMGHLFAIGGSASDSESPIYVGGLGDIGSEDFPTSFNYIALGHLHRPQKIGNNNNIQYSGSPYILSFSEINYDKKVILLELENNTISNIKDIIVPKFRDILRVTGTVESCIKDIENICKKNHKLTPWVEVILDDKDKSLTGNTEIYNFANELNVEVLKITLKNEKQIIGLEQLLENTKRVKDLKPTDVFKMKCKEQDFNVYENPEILDAFMEVINEL